MTATTIQPEPKNQEGAVPLYSVGTWDTDAQAYTPQADVPSFNLTKWDLRRSLRALRQGGYSCHRVRSLEDWGDPDDGPNAPWVHESDTFVMVERTDGASEAEILEGWKR